MLAASAHSAAMMLYLDNAQSVAAQPERPMDNNGRRPQFALAQVRQGAERGLAPAVQMMARVREIAKNQNITEEQAYERLSGQGILGGVPLSRFDAADQRRVLVAVTEMNERAELDRLVAALARRPA